MTASLIMLVGAIVLVWAICGTTVEKQKNEKKPQPRRAVAPRPANQVNSPENLKKILEEEPLTTSTYKRLKEATENKNNVRFN